MDIIYKGKVRDVYNINNKVLLISTSDRTSSFNRHICDIEGKGRILNMTSCKWFKLTEHIIPNHLICNYENYYLVKKCKPFKIEIVVRGYITGNTETSLWTHYNKGVREYCGVKFPDGLVKDQKLENPVVTPTTKDDSDKPISPTEIVDEGYMTQEQLDYVYDKAMKLFMFGSKYAKSKDLILVDTKYEFGLDDEGNILLIDELHTCDSSRYWVSIDETGPKKLDKDQIRDWVKDRCDPYKDEIPEIPENVKNKVLESYKLLYKILFPEENKKYAFILYGSDSDNDHVQKIEKYLNMYDIRYDKLRASAHKETYKLLHTLKQHKNDKLVWVTVAGRSNALSGVVASNTTQPCISCPPFSDKLDMFVNIHSSIQMPSKVPVMTVLEPVNVAMCIKNIFSLHTNHLC